MKLESLSIGPFKNQEEMDEFVARKRQRLLEIEMQKEKEEDETTVPQTEEGSSRPQPTTTETMPTQLMDAINELGGDDVMWVMKKTLTSTDMRPTHNRLSMPERQVRSKFLTDEERMQASNDGIPVDVLVLGKRAQQQPDLWSLVFKKWSMSKTNIYVLIRRWAKLVKEESLEEGHTIQIWSFRGSENGGGGGKKLCFAINVV